MGYLKTSKGFENFKINWPLIVPNLNFPLYKNPDCRPLWGGDWLTNRFSHQQNKESKTIRKCFTRSVFSTFVPCLKVSKSRKQNFKFAPKTNEQSFFCISALAYKKRSNQKNSVGKSKLNPPMIGMKSLFLIWPLFRS